MRPAERNLAIYRGDDYAHRITFKHREDGVDVAFPVPGAFTAQIRASEHDATVVATFLVDDDDADPGGVVVIHLPAVVTAVLPGRAAWDLQRVHDGVTETYLAGEVIADGDVTRAEA